MTTALCRCDARPSAEKMEMELVVCKGVNAESPLTCSLGPGVPETPTPLGPHNVPASALRRAHAQSPTFPASSVAAAMDLSDCGGLNIASPARCFSWGVLGARSTKRGESNL